MTEDHTQPTDDRSADSLSDALSKFAKFSPDFMAEGRDDQEQTERDAL